MEEDSPFQRYRDFIMTRVDVMSKLNHTNKIDTSIDRDSLLHITQAFRDRPRKQYHTLFLRYSPRDSLLIPLIPYYMNVKTVLIITPTRQSARLVNDQIDNCLEASKSKLMSEYIPFHHVVFSKCKIIEEYEDFAEEDVIICVGKDVSINTSENKRYHVNLSNIDNTKCDLVIIDHIECYTQTTIQSILNYFNLSRCILIDKSS